MVSEIHRGDSASEPDSNERGRRSKNPLLFAFSQWLQPKTPSDRTWSDEVRTFLDSQSTLRRFLIMLTGVGVPILVAVLQSDKPFGLSKDQATTVIYFLAALGAVLGILLTATERSSGDIARSLSMAELKVSELNQARKSDREHLRRERERHKKHLARLGGLEALRQRLSFAVQMTLIANARTPNQGQLTRNSLFFILSELGALSHEVFEWPAGEEWSLAAYVWNDATSELQCCAAVRPTRSDYGEGHRRWQLGRGMVGMCFWTAKQLVVSDAYSSELESVMRDPDEQRATQDRDAYRSVAAVPIFKAEAFNVESDGAVHDSPENISHTNVFGVLVATSDAPGRFSTGDDDELSLTALSAVADALGIVMMTAGLKGLFTDAPNGGEMESAASVGKGIQDEQQQDRG